MFTVVCYANTLKGLLNAQLSKKDYGPLNFGIGVEYGRALMIKAGYNGSGINDVIYMGDVVNRAAHLAHKAGRSPWGTDPIWAGEVFAQNLNEDNAKFLTATYESGVGNVRKGSVVMTHMNDWINENLS